MFHPYATSDTNPTQSFINEAPGSPNSYSSLQPTPLRKDLLSGHHLAPISRPVETPGLVPGRGLEVPRGLPQAVVDTITSARAPSTRLAYASRFLKGARRLNPPRISSIPSWDLSLVLTALLRLPFEPLRTVELKILSLKTVLLLALASIKRVGDLHAFSVDESCLEFGPADSQVILRPWPGYVPKGPTTPFRDQVVNLQALPLEEADSTLAFLCPVRTLWTYLDRTQSFRTSDQLFICFGGLQKGKAVSKQRLAHWIVDAIILAYDTQGVPCPPGLHAHSTRSVAASWALAQCASLADVCRAAGWATPNTFARGLADTRKQMMRDHRRQLRKVESRQKKEKQKSDRILKTFESAVEAEPGKEDSSGPQHFSATALSSWHHIIMSNSSCYSVNNMSSEHVHLPMLGNPSRSPDMRSYSQPNLFASIPKPSTSKPSSAQGLHSTSNPSVASSKLSPTADLTRSRPALNPEPASKAKAPSVTRIPRVRNLHILPEDEGRGAAHPLRSMEGGHLVVVGWKEERTSWRLQGRGESPSGGDGEDGGEDPA
ncbi:unnamed protein product [Leuciscus chuanchicus]